MTGAQDRAEQGGEDGPVELRVRLLAHAELQGQDEELDQAGSN
jgi:hypothetical protein